MSFNLCLALGTCGLLVGVPGANPALACLSLCSFQQKRLIDCNKPHNYIGISSCIFQGKKENGGIKKAVAL
jgi:hypothetical protein